AITGNQVIVKTLPEGTSFITLDDKERKLKAGDLMICNANDPMCMAGVYGGAHSGVTAKTTDIFLESAWFHPITIRKTSMGHGLRTDAATRFEKGVDISNVVEVLKRAALLIREVAGGEIVSDIVDVYPQPRQKTEVAIKYHYLKKLSGKNYHSDAIKNILTALGFEVLKEGIDDIRLAVPFSKPDISLPADIVEEIMRIDGLDNVEIPAFITIAPSVEQQYQPAQYREKITGYLTGLGCNEIFTNSITNGAYYSQEELSRTVKMINSLSAELNVMRLSMVETGLESVAYNLNRRNNDLQFFEFGKTYETTGEAKYAEWQHLALFFTGNKRSGGWQQKAEKVDYYYARSVAERVIQLAGISQIQIQVEAAAGFEYACQIFTGKEKLATVGLINKTRLQVFDIKQPVYFVDIYWDALMLAATKKRLEYKEIPKFPAVQRDLAIVVDRALGFEKIEQATQEAHVKKLTSLHLFDIFESEKLGAGKKSMALNFTFLDEEKTLTDKEIDAMMNKLIQSYEKNLQAEIRK
ncbi:MAG: hypothetical protein RLY16_525, partial [Bacteroidota bacterium]